MEAYILVVLVEFFYCVNGDNAVGFHNLILYEWVKSANLHVKTLSNACNVAAHCTIGVDTQGLALELCARSTVVAVADEIYDHTKHELGNSICVLSWSVHNTHTVLSGLVKVNVVITSTSTNYHLQLWSSVKHLFINFVAAHD